MADWEEIKRLAADFQKIQLSSTTQKLSERNCIEIISWLIDRKIIDLIFTTDGKEYLTPCQLIQEIKNELIVNNGRVNLVELSKSIGVDLAHINHYLNDVVKGQKEIHIILGQLIDSSYIHQIAEEINEKLNQLGQINISDLTIQYDLPADFLQQQVLEKNLGRLIQGKQDKNDPRVFFTESFIARSIHKIRGALNALTRPTPVSAIINQIGVSEKLFFTLFEDVRPQGFLTGKMTGAQYIPDIYSRYQTKWVNNFYKQNDYLEFDALVRLGILDYKIYIKNNLSSEGIIFLNSCVISKRILERLEADIEECIFSKSCINLQNNLPTVFNDKDIELILQQIFKSKQKKDQIIYIDNYVISKTFLEKLKNNCKNLINENAKKIVESGKYQQHQIQLSVKNKNVKDDEEEEKSDKKEERRKKATGGKSGGGTQGRETKTKSTKKHQTRKVIVESDDEESSSSNKKELEVIKLNEINKTVEVQLEEEGMEDLIQPISEYLLPILNEEGLKIANEIYRQTVADRTANRRQTHNELQSKINTLLGDVRLFEKGLKLLNGDLQQQLIKYLLKTICTDIVNDILNYLAVEQNLNVQVENFNQDQRLKLINDLGPEFKSLTPLVKSLAGQSIDDFMNSIEEGLHCCSMIIKKVDKKKDKTVILNHKYQLLEQLNKCEDLPLILHLATLVIFTSATQNIVYASGRHIAGILAYLKQYLNEEQINELLTYHDFVMLMLSAGTEAESAKEKLKEMAPTIKNIANNYKKSGEKNQ